MKWGTKQLTAQIKKIKIYATTPTNSTEERECERKKKK